MASEKRSFAHLSAKFNTEAPAGYVPGQGRGAGGFSQLPADYVPRGRGGGSSGAGPSSGGEASVNSGPARKVPMQFALGEDEKNTAVDISKTNAYEERGLSLDFKEAGYEIEPFNLEAEREGGKFDQDGTYIPKRRRGRGDIGGDGDDEEEEDANDAWLQSMDEMKESDEKVAKRKRAAQLAEQRLERAQAEEDAADVPALRLECAGFLEPGETVLQALRRLGGGGASTRGRGMGAAAARGGAAGGIGGRSKPSPADKAQFDALTDVASRLMAAGHVTVYSDSREALASGVRSKGSDAFPPMATAGGSAEVEGANGHGGEGGGAVPTGGYVLDESSGCYYNSSTGFYFDPRSQLHWDPRVQPAAYFYFDSASGAYVPWQAASAPAAL